MIEERFVPLFAKLNYSKFRSSFHLKQKDIDYINNKGMDVIKKHAIDFIKTREAPAFIRNDGKQTPTHGHPVFVAQHATATCCRGCIYKWHHIAQNKQLSQQEQDYLVDVIMNWINKEVEQFMKYKFWNAHNVHLRVINNEFPGIETPFDLYDALSSIWCKETCAPRLQENWTKENKTLGQCSITAFLAQDIFGGKVYGIKLKDGNYHCFNIIGKEKFDLTSEQFKDEKLDYNNVEEQSRENHFAKEEKRLRYEYLKKQLKEYCLKNK